MTETSSRKIFVLKFQPTLENILGLFLWAKNIWENERPQCYCSVKTLSVLFSFISVFNQIQIILNKKSLSDTSVSLPKFNKVQKDKFQSKSFVTQTIAKGNPLSNVNEKRYNQTILRFKLIHCLNSGLK